jgi:hypothetical protein
MFDDLKVGIVISDTEFFTDEHQSRQLFSGNLPRQGMVFHDLLESYYVSLETVVMRRSAIDSLSHGFDAELSHISDMDLIVRLSKDWKLVCAGEVLAKWRVHSNSASWAEPGRFYQEKLQFVKKMDELPEFQPLWAISRQRFLLRTAVSEAITRLAGGERVACRQLLSEHLFASRKAAMVFGLSWMPYGDRVMKLYRQKKAMV